MIWALVIAMSGVCTRTRAPSDPESQRVPAILVYAPRIGDAGLGESFGAQQATVAVPARRPAGPGIVAARGQAVVEAEIEAAPDDLGLGHRDERRVHAHARAF